MPHVLSRMHFTRQMGRAEDTVALPLEGVMALVEVYACSTLLHVRAPSGRRAQKAVILRPPCFVGTGETACADDTVPLEPPNNMWALTTGTLTAARLQLPMLTNPLRPRTTFHTSLLVPVPPTLCLSVRTPQMLMTLWTVARNRSMIAWLIEPGHFRFSYLTLRPFLLSPSTRYRPQTATHECTVPLHTSGDLSLPSTYFPPSAHTRLPPTSHTNSRRRKRAAKASGQSRAK